MASSISTSAPGTFKETAAAFIELAKPRIIVLLVITGLAAMAVASRGNLELLTPWQILATLTALVLSSGGANMVNMWYDRDIDVLMRRTQKRPIPSGRIRPRTALAGGIICGLLGWGLATFAVNALTGLLLAGGYLFYVFVYTFGLKRYTTQNIVIGGAAGAFPPLVGWAAVHGGLDWLPWAMFAVIFLWTPPHFWALALEKNADYSNAGIPMLPVVKGERETKLQMLYYFLILFPVTLGMAAFYPLGWITFTAAFGLGMIWLFLLIRLMYGETRLYAGKNFSFSIIYLCLLFSAMGLDTFI